MKPATITDQTSVRATADDAADAMSTATDAPAATAAADAPAATAAAATPPQPLRSQQLPPNHPSQQLPPNHPFAHYLYVVECADGSLYTGYAIDVEARVAAHNAGRGAKYTKTRRPVNLLAKARFYTKQRAMSAEWHFKQLTRDEKDELLTLSVSQPFEDVLAERLTALGPAPIGEFTAQQLAAHVDPEYRAFMAKLTPSVNPKTIVGVRTPALRKIARQMAKRPDLDAFLRATPHALFEENQLHSFAIGCMTDYQQALARIDAFLPYVDNWATCDQMPTKILAKDPQQSLEHIMRWLASSHVYTARYGIKALMQNYLGEWFAPEHMDWVAAKHVPGYQNPEPASPAYYLDMMRAWYFAEAMAKQPQLALPFLLHPQEGGNGALDEWTRKKAIQKSIESYRVTDELKATLKEARRPKTP